MQLARETNDAPEVETGALVEEDVQRRYDTLLSTTAGAAHDLNNLLMCVLVMSEHVYDRLEDGGSRCAMETCISAARSAAVLSEQLTTTSRGWMLRPKTFELNAAIAAIEPLLHWTARPPVTLATTLAKESLMVSMPLGQLDQLLLNLVANAQEAMPNGGRIELRTGSTEREGRRWARIVVRDEGSGIPAELLRRVFEPHFSTKAIDRGIGLSACRKMLLATGGDIMAANNPERGATFTIELPRVGDIGS